MHIMGNFTEIENIFNLAVTPKINNLLKTIPQNTPQFQNEVSNIISGELSNMRFGFMKDISNITNRNVISYISAWLQGVTANTDYSITDNDINGLMNAVAGLDRSKGLDLILHTPGGVITATESIVKYLRLMFHNDIRVIVPHMAMSAGTMIACACKEIIMGKESSLGPIDPQYRNAPAQGILKEFRQAIAETQADPNVSLIWKEIIQQYRPAFVGECQNIVDLSYALVKDWLYSCMFKKSKIKEQKVSQILDELASHDNSKVHDRHYNIDDCKKIGLKVIPLEKDQMLQDKVLSLYHTYILSIYRIPSTLKFIENQNGQTFIITGKR